LRSLHSGLGIIVVLLCSSATPSCAPASDEPPLVPNVPNGTPTWTTRQAHGVVRLTRDWGTSADAATSSGRLSASFASADVSVSPRPPAGGCIGGPPPKSAFGPVDAGELHVAGTDGRGQGIPVRPAEDFSYFTAIHPEFLGDGTSVVLTASGGAFPAFESRVTWASSRPILTLLATRAADGGIEMRWEPGQEQETLTVSILTSRQDPTVLATCSLNPSAGRASLARGVLDATGAASGKGIHVILARDHDTPSRDALVAIELEDVRDIDIPR